MTRSWCQPLVLLAGGRGSRMGMPKALLASGRWLDEQLEALACAGVSRVVLVLGHALGEQLAALPWIERHLGRACTRAGLSLRVVVNPQPGRGPFSSLQVGLSAADGPALGAFVLPIDTACPEGSVFAALADAMGPGVDAATPSFRGRGGHPVLLGGPLASRVLAASPDGRLDRMLRALPVGRRVRVPVRDPRVLTDLDTPTELAAHRGA